MGKRMSTPSKYGTPGPGSYENGHDLYYKTLAGSKIGTDVRKGDFLKTASFNK